MNTITDLKLAARRLGDAPIFTSVFVLTLGIGIGALTSVVAVANAIFFLPLPYEDPARIVEVRASASPEHAEPGDYLIDARVTDWLQTDFRTLESFAARGESALVLRRAEGTIRMTAEVVSGRYFEVVGGRAARGRVIVPSDDQPGAEPAVLLSHAAWVELFERADDILGQTVSLSGRVHSVIGVMPETFDSRVKVWVPRANVPVDHAMVPWRAFGRLRPGFEQADAAVEIRTRAATETSADSARYAGQGAVGIPMGRMLRRSRDGSLWAALGATGTLFLIALANLTALFLSRAASNGRASSVRLALGASPWNLARVHLAEGAVLGAASLTLGLGLAVWGVQASLYWLGGEYLLPVEPRLDVRVLGFAALLAAASSTIFALEPARHFSTTDLQRLLVRSSGVLTMGLRERRGRNMLVGAQVSLSVLLLGTAGIIGYRYQAFVERDMGYDDTSVMTAVPDYDAVGIDEYRQPELGIALLDRLHRRPEVTASALWRFIAQSYPPQPQHAAELEDGLGGPSAVPMSYFEITPTFFDLMDITLLRGRGFDPSDDMRSEPVAIVTEGAAGRWWPEGPLLGRRLRFGSDGAWTTVVGVAGDIGSLDYLGRFWDASGYSPPSVFRPMAQAEQRSDGWNDGRGCVGRCGGVTIAASGPGHPTEVAAAIRQELGLLEPDLPMRETGTLLDRQINAFGGHQMRLSRGLFSGASLIGIIVALVGVLGIVGEGVSRRTREIGVRRALGAPAWRVMVSVCRESIGTVLVGLGVGLAGSYFLRTVLQAVVVPFGRLDLGLEAGDWRVLAVAGIVILSATGATAILAARSAARVEPTVALRAE